MRLMRLKIIMEGKFMSKCIILEMENCNDFQRIMNEYLILGYRVEASSCNSKYYKAILILRDDKEN